MVRNHKECRKNAFYCNKQIRAASIVVYLRITIKQLHHTNSRHIIIRQSKMKHPRTAFMTLNPKTDPTQTIEGSMLKFLLRAHPQMNSKNRRQRTTIRSKSIIIRRPQKTKTVSKRQTVLYKLAKRWGLWGWVKSRDSQGRLTRELCQSQTRKYREKSPNQPNYYFKSSPIINNRQF